jgi:tetratricopeptide (TPR) repeat protein
VKTLEDQHVSRRRPGGPDALSVVLAGARSLHALLGTVRPPPFAWLRDGTDRACALARAGRHDELTSVLADLLPALEAAARSQPEFRTADVYELMALAYQSCSAALARMNQPEAAWIAADRAMAAAERAGNLLLVAAGAQRLTSVFLGAERYALAEETARTTVTALQDLAAAGDPDAISVCGGLTLLRAVIAARSGRPAAAGRHLAYARRLAGSAEQEPGIGGAFGPGQVRLYEIAVSVDLGDAGHALRLAAAAPAGLPACHQARMLVDVARAHALRGQAEDAAAALDQAAAVDPEFVRDSEPATRLLRDLLARSSPPPAAVRLAARLGITTA